MEVNKIYNMDCLKGLKKLKDNSVDLVLTDPPYFNIMIRDHKGNKYGWDKFKTIDEYIEWIELISLEFKRVLKNNGSLYMFADDKVSAYIQVMMDKYFNLENNIIWVKPNNMTIKGWKNFRCYATITERLLFYSKEARNNNLENETYKENIKTFAPIIEYMKEQKRLIKDYFKFKTDLEFNNYINNVTNTSSVVSRHYFTYSQWVFPTKKIYEKLQNINKYIFKKEYEIFKKEYESIRRQFAPEKNYTDVWTFNIISGKENTDHPTQKPLKIIKRIINTSSREGDLVLDPFMGSGTTAIACKELGRKYIGFELEKEYCDIAEERLKEVNNKKLNEWF